MEAGRYRVRQLKGEIIKIKYAHSIIAAALYPGDVKEDDRVVTMIIVSLLMSSALFLILELDRPFDGVIQVSSAPMRNALSHLTP